MADLVGRIATISEMEAKLPSQNPNATLWESRTAASPTLGNHGQTRSLSKEGSDKGTRRRRRRRRRRRASKTRRPARPSRSLRVATVASRVGPSLACLLFSGEEMALRFVMEDGKLNLCLRNLVEFREDTGAEKRVSRASFWGEWSFVRRRESRWTFFFERERAQHRARLVPTVVVVCQNLETVIKYESCCSEDQKTRRRTSIERRDVFPS